MQAKMKASVESEPKIELSGLAALAVPFISHPIIPAITAGINMVSTILEKGISSLAIGFLISPEV